jgi:DNA transformation protein and related proteins
MAAEHFEDRVVRLLSGLGDLTSRPLFGGYGLSRRETIFGILFGGKLFLKVGDRSKGDSMVKGMGPFRPNERQTLKSYYEVPPEVIDDPEALLSWVGEAIRTA